MITATIENIQELQARNQEMIAALKPSGAMGEAVRVTAAELQRYAISITHVGRYIQSKSGRWRYARPHEQGRGGGALRASHRMTFNESGSTASATINIDASTANPLTGQKPSVYGVYEHRRGGEHAFYSRAVRERGAEAKARGVAALRKGMVRP
jgi:hypothetical protein